MILSEQFLLRFYICEMITPLLKDTILKDLINKAPDLRFSGTFEEEAAFLQVGSEIYKLYLISSTRKN
jgi:hypothetical protein